MIRVGLSGFGDHEELYGNGVRASERLKAYSAYFGVVELDNSFYAVQPVRNYLKWLSETPHGFQFVIKAYQGMTGHLRGEKNYFDSDEAMFAAFHTSIQPVIEEQRLSMVLFQYPPWFECNQKNVAILRKTRERMGDVPCAVEFRNQTWYTPETREKTLAFLSKQQWIHTIADEPQAGMGSIPIVLGVTTPDKTLIRLHGRNVSGWHKSSDPDWRKLRYLYRYNMIELSEWRDRLRELEKSCETLYVMFNNNSGGDAADNAKQLISLLGEGDQGLAPRQLDLFE
ncbi:DUF72 domain-containing protein [Paenibacillus psychroresistens]|uniref:DUF72 domain-containing protein n=1 Tax=Paenibacillus psychroresistens TaxID=1778678 RepID=A0A6B8RN23_9BACL|nr:DUF72 domain-containing protein [Paenibacillus psychroresistens]QGQ96776.1 DUF72 domain-containing protein [Paenibacillus psychroresistens]